MKKWGEKRDIKKWMTKSGKQKWMRAKYYLCCACVENLILMQQKNSTCVLKCTHGYIYTHQMGMQTSFMTMFLSHERNNMHIAVLNVISQIEGWEKRSIPEWNKCSSSFCFVLFTARIFVIVYSVRASVYSMGRKLQRTVFCKLFQLLSRLA